jgi:hypothetical protein
MLKAKFWRIRPICNGSAGKPGSGSWSISSDRRLKKNIEGLDGSLGKSKVWSWGVS